MSYIDGFVAAVPSANREVYRDHAAKAAKVFREYGATQCIECWGDDVPEGKVTSFPMAVQAQGRRDGGLLLGRLAFARGARTTAWKKIMDDPRMSHGGEPDAVRRPAADLRRLRPDRRGLKPPLPFPRRFG